MLFVMAVIIRAEFSQFSKLKTTETLVTELTSDLLELRRNEKDFLSRKQLKYVDSFQEISTNLDSDFSELKQLLVDLGIEYGEIDQLHTLSNGYESTFKQIVNLQKIVGLNPKDGLYGGLRKSVHDSEDLLKQSGDFRLISDMLMLRRHEKDFMLRRNLKYVDKFDKRIQTFKNNLQSSSLSSVDINQASANIEAYFKDFKALVTAEEEIGLTVKEGLLGKMRSETHELEAGFKRLTEELIKKVESAESQVETILYLGVAIIVIFIAGLMSWLTLTISKRLNSATLNMKEIAVGDGDLTRRMNETGKDEIAELAKAFNVFTQKIHDTLQTTEAKITKLNETGAEVLNGATETDNSMQHLRENTQTVVVAIEELSSTAQEVASNINNVSTSSQEANNQASDGKCIVDQAVDSINSFAIEFDEAAEAIRYLRSETDNIGSILDVIREIAEQTNLLALNAAIEAARAGEQGRGFAVVADEVRTLAHRSHESTNKIQELIGRLQDRAGKAVATIEKGQESVVSTVEKTEHAGAALNMITQSVQTITDMTTQIATASEEQSAVVLDISKSLTNIDGLAENTATIADNSSKLSLELSSTISDVKQEIERFKFAEN
jgi:methyl-accepting chemotaxis protein